ncbi:Predicted DNA-binding transcriptional regulator YafY, contains an HTH and WYL domains [Jannaschia faecimaris]|uniref:Predicted DNA-binding transcriptional regulator YafY, contains an HTH and WYL domains n=1 Tax=Jannaschia faecimaris TaxID=1244108 RepID=A0A1H3SPV8_9RHOB|nr:YafY family protein [Jannaschia faecimaris]SDZ40036.1 Predicted DNA-binding transcriptional regulator YafY, contains an HTH and WYL domains [Jannaschia faecimaris]
MRRSERLAEIVEIVRDGRLHLARDIADALEVSLRTIYRDIDTLAASGVPIDGERGVGYILREPVFLPPMALSLIELEALSLGMAIVQEAADEELQSAARSLLGKVGDHASNRRRAPKSWGFGVYAFECAQEGFKHMPLLRRAIRDRMKLRIAYRSLTEQSSERVIRPLQADYWGRVWTCSAWCELRGGFRAFRIDRMLTVETTGKHFEPEPGKTIEDYLKHVDDQMERDRVRS